MLLSLVNLRLNSVAKATNNNVFIISRHHNFDNTPPDRQIDVMVGQAKAQSLQSKQPTPKRITVKGEQLSGGQLNRRNIMIDLCCRSTKVWSWNLYRQLHRYEIDISLSLRSWNRVRRLLIDWSGWTASNRTHSLWPTLSDRLHIVIPLRRGS